MIDYTRLQPDELAAEVQGHMDEVVRDYATLNQRQLNWTAHPTRWSVGQCLDHLVTMDRRYLDRLGPAVAVAREGGRLGSGPYTGTAFGRWFTRQVGPMINERSANTLRSVIRAPAPTRQYWPMTAWLRIVAPMPTSEKSPTVQPWTVAPWPIVTPLPIVHGASPST